jgi:predicted RecB family nuclease
VEIQATREKLGDAIRATRELVANREVPAIFEATFEHGGVLVRVDILQRRDRKRWRLLEVKSTADLKDYHLYDVAIQSRVLSRCGVQLSSSALMHLNRDYVFQGGSYDLRCLFRIRNLNRQLPKLQKKLTKQLRDEFRILRESKPPEIDPGRQCQKPVRCEFFDCCNRMHPANHVTLLPRISPRALDELKRLGIESIADIPEDFPLDERQSRAHTSVKARRLYCRAGLDRQLQSLKYPLAFMDFETVNPALPRFSGMKPFNHLPFQWSVHRQDTPTAPLEHFEFLADDDGDPRLTFLQSLLKTIQGASTIVVYYGIFESGRLSELAQWFPQYHKQIAHVQKKIWDLLPIIRENVYHPEFRGSYSLKRVLPALVPAMTYETMDVSDGAKAGLAWEKMRSLAKDCENRQEIRHALLAYCEQDTLAMVRLLDVLRSISDAPA